MKRLALAVITCSLVACGSDDDGGGGSGGSAGSGGNAGSGGSAGTGGTGTGGTGTGGTGTGGTGTGGTGTGGTGTGGTGTGGTGTGGTGTGGTGTGGTGTGGTGTGGTGTGGTGTGGTGTGGTGTGGSGAASASADEVGALFYKKSDGSNTLRWLKSDGTQRVAASYSLSNNWQTITSVKKLAGAGAEVVFHMAGGSAAQNPIAAVGFNNDTTSSQKTNDYFGLVHDLATKVEEGRGLWFDKETGHWVAGGWGATAWDSSTMKEGTLAPAAYTSMFGCNADKYVYFHEKDTDKLHRREYKAGGLDATITTITVAKGALATCVDSAKGLVLIYATDGKGWLYQWGSTAPTAAIASWTNFSWDWSHIVLLRSGHTLFYRKSDGIGATAVFTETTPWSSQKGSFAAGTFPKDIDLVTAL